MDMAERTVIELDTVRKAYPDGTVAVEGLSLAVREHEVLALVGPSGCGKSTTLRMVNRLVEPTSGRILLDGEDVTRADPVQLRRRIGYVIQNVGLFPHRTVESNIATVPGLLGWDRRRTRARVAELLDLVGLPAATYAKRYPNELSGVSASASASPGRSRPTRPSCSWTSPSVRSTPSSGGTCRPSSSASSARPGPR
nr:hypothetical protein GCM10025730_17480 [Promicromonospora thailandica]